MDLFSNKAILIVYRLILALFFTLNFVHPDGIWQSIEVGYDIVYGGVKLPWEWRSDYRMRSPIYPYILSIPLYILKVLGLDHRIIVVMCPYVLQCFLVLISDHYLWEIGKITIGKNASRIAFILYIVNKASNEVMMRCFTNGIETILSIIAFYYYLNCKE